VAVNVEPDVLILDETLSVGDAVYKEKALQTMYELRDSGTTILFVSHAMQTIQDFCTEAALLHEGRLMSTGETTEVINHYRALTSNLRATSSSQERLPLPPQAWSTWALATRNTREKLSIPAAAREKPESEASRH
jgi:ABC-type glutathione transport system ATPase component